MNSLSGFSEEKKDAQANADWKINTYVLVFRILYYHLDF